MTQPSTLFSATGKPLGRIFKNASGFGFEHAIALAREDGFATWQEARDAFMAFHNTWFETHYG